MGECAAYQHEAACDHSAEAEGTSVGAYNVEGLRWTVQPDITSLVAAANLIRFAEHRDLSTVVALWRECGMVTGSHNPNDDFALSLCEPTTAVIVAVTPRNDVIGTAMAERQGWRGHLWYIAVDPAHRAEGIGRALVKGCERWLSDNGAVSVELSLQSNETGIVRFYRDMGYELSALLRMHKRLIPF